MQVVGQSSLLTYSRAWSIWLFWFSVAFKEVRRDILGDSVLHVNQWCGRNSRKERGVHLQIKPMLATTRHAAGKPNRTERTWPRLSDKLPGLAREGDC